MAERAAKFTNWLGSKKIVTFLLATMIVISGFYFSFYQVRRHQAFWTYIDLATTEQILWNTIHGRVYANTIYPTAGEVVRDFTDRVTENRLGTHVQPTLLLLAPIYYLIPRAETLLVVMCLAVVAGVIPFFRIARRRFRSDLYALVLAGVYLLLPAVETACGWDIHITSFALPLILMALDAAECENRWLWWMASLLAMGTREDVPFLVGWGMAWMVPSKMRRQALVMFLIGLSWSVINFFVIIPHYSGDVSPYLAFFLSDGLEPSGQAFATDLMGFSNLIRVASRFLLYNLNLGLPLLFLYWLQWPSVIASLPLLVVNSLSHKTVMILPSQSHYSLTILPWLLVGTVDGLLVVHRWLSKRYAGLGYAVLPLVISVLASHITAGYTPLNSSFVWPRRTEQNATAYEVLAAIPENAPASLDMHLAAHAAQREILRIFPDLRDVEWVALNAWYGGYPYGMQPSVWHSLFSNPLWETVRAEDGLILLHRSGSGPPQELDHAWAAPDSIEPSGRVVFAKDQHQLILSEVEIVPLPLGNYFLCSSWSSGGESGPGVPWVNAYAGESRVERPLSSAIVIPGIYSGAKNEVYRDCTDLVTLANANEVEVAFSVRDDGNLYRVEINTLENAKRQVVGGSHQVRFILDAPW